MSRISVRATLYTRTSSQDIHPPGEGQRTHAHQVRDRGRPQGHWTSCDQAARLTTSPQLHPETPCPAPRSGATPQRGARPACEEAWPRSAPSPRASQLPEAKKGALKAEGPEPGLQPTRGAHSAGEAQSAKDQVHTAAQPRGQLSLGRHVQGRRLGGQPHLHQQSALPPGWSSPIDGKGEHRLGGGAA